MRPLRPEERLIVAADYPPSECGGSQGALEKALDLAKKISGLGVYYKMNAPLRFFGCQRLVKEVHDLGLKIFADLKLIDISETMGIDAQYLQELQPDIVTVMCLAGVKGMNAVQQIIGGRCEVLGVTILTSLSDKDCDAIFTCSAAAAVLRLAKLAAKAEIGGLVMSGKELNIVNAEKELVLLSRNTPGVRPLWSVVKGDDQDPKRIVTPSEAMLNGADRIVVGRPITQAADPREAVLKTLAEIEQGIELRKQKEKE